MKESVLITGATGFIGSNLARKLVEEGFDVNIIIRQTSDTWRLHDILRQIKVSYADITDFGSLKAVVNAIKPEVIFHLANAGVYGGKSLPETEVIKINLMGTLNLINACRDIDYRCFINTGSSAEYGKKEKPMKESDICEPGNAYGISKLASTLYASNFANQTGKPIINVRLFSPFGPFDDPARLITYASINAIEGNDLELANPYSERDYIYVGDVVDFYQKSIRLADKLKGSVFNLGSGKGRNVQEVVKKILKFSGSGSKVLWNKAPPRQFDALHWSADMSRTKRHFKNLVLSSFDASLKKTVLWFKERVALKSYRLPSLLRGSAIEHKADKGDAPYGKRQPLLCTAKPSLMATRAYARLFNATKERKVLYKKLHH